MQGKHVFYPFYDMLIPTIYTNFPQKKLFYNDVLDLENFRNFGSENILLPCLTIHISEMVHYFPTLFSEFVDLLALCGIAVSIYQMFSS